MCENVEMEFTIKQDGQEKMFLPRIMRRNTKFIFSAILKTEMVSAPKVECL